MWRRPLDAVEQHGSTHLAGTIGAVACPFDMHSSLLHVYLCLHTRHVVLPRSNGPEPTHAFCYLLGSSYSAFYHV
jgi:hypothetical protein